MWGTVTPDQRPTDLGVNDGGFDFRGTDDAREFIWSQTQWIEVTEVRYGTHAGRPNPLDVVNGALYVEFDRGGAIYQNQDNVWKYLAGTMWGTLSPDQRPTDLGVNDAGFDFRGTDQQREFIWSQTVWVEVTPVTGALNLTHPNVVTKVGTAGQIVEGGITDESAGNSDRLHISSAGIVSIARAPYPDPNHIFQVRVATDRNVFFGAVAGPEILIQCLNDAVSNYVSFTLAASSYSLKGLRSSNPGAGSQQLWYDPADGNRVKYAP
jgi:hypothetical protein